MMKISYKLLFTLTAFFFMSVVAYAAQEARNSGYKPKETQQTTTESTTILIFKAPAPESPEGGNVRKAGRAERTTAIPNISRLKADNRKSIILSLNA